MKESKTKLRIIQISEMISLALFIVIYVFLRILRNTITVNNPEIFADIKNYYIAIEISVVITFMVQTATNLLLFLYSRNIEKQNENFSMISEQTQAIVFNYDYQKKRLELSGNIQNLSKDGQDVFNGDQVNEVLGLIHSDDILTYVEIKNLPNSDKTQLNAEMRLKTLDDSYQWFRMTGSVIRNNEGAALKFLGNLTNVEEERRKEMQLTQKASLDSLTGLLNKGAFEESVTKLLQSSSRNEIFAFYIIDLDYFKTVNDTLGHSVGDQVLADTARKLCVIFNDHDIVGRIGGDEFAALLRLSLDVRKISSQIIETKANAICEKLNRIFENENLQVNVSASVGVSIYPKHGRSYMELYKSADKVLYISKNNGKNQYTINGDEVQN